jgi:hypothetical protein
MKIIKTQEKKKKIYSSRSCTTFSIVFNVKKLTMYFNQIFKVFNVATLLIIFVFSYEIYKKDINSHILLKNKIKPKKKKKKKVVVATHGQFGGGRNYSQTIEV